MEIQTQLLEGFIVPTHVLYKTLICDTVSSDTNVCQYDKILVLQDTHEQVPGFELVQVFHTIDKSLTLYEKKDLSPSDVTFVIQGLDHTHTWKVILYSIPYGSVCMGIWTDDELQHASKYVQDNKIHNKHNRFFQVVSTLKGLRDVKTPFAIKIRSDEYFINYTQFIQQMKAMQPQQILCSNIYFRDLRGWLYHISDHILGSRTDNLLIMFGEALRLLQLNQCLDTTPEQLLARSYISHYESIPFMNNKTYYHLQVAARHMVIFFDIYNICDFDDFEMKHYGERKTKVSNLAEIVEVRSMKDILQCLQ